MRQQMDSDNLKRVWTTSVGHLQNQFQMLNCLQNDEVSAANDQEEDVYAFHNNKLNHVLHSQEHSIFHDPFIPLGEPFPCIADELEQQAKALEFSEWARSASTRALPPSSSSGCAAKDITTAAAAAAAISDSPLLTASPSRQDTLDPETLIDTSAMLPCSLLSPPPPPPSSSAPPTAAGPTAGGPNNNNVPLAAALENARSVRMHGGKSCQEGGWRGCCGSPWCNRERSHLGPCNSRASVPGLAAYPDALLSTAAVDLQKLCYSSAAPIVGGAHNNSKNKRPYYSKNNDNDNDVDQPLSPTGVIRGEMGASGGEDLETSSPTASGGSGGAYHHHRMAGAGTQYRLVSNKNGGDCGDEFYSDEARSALTGEIKLHPHHHSYVVGANNNNVRMSKQDGKKASRLGNGGNIGGPMKPSSQALYLSSTKLKKQGSMKRSGGGGSHKAGGGSKSSSKRDPTQSASAWPKQPKGPRSGPRKQVTWVMGKVTDPTTGEEVTEVGPATFCTQCHAQSTPVWRAGPFGHKTLCNACGVRWMKIKPSGRKQD